MITENALAVYKNRPALVREITGDKITIALPGGEGLKVREKDIELIHPGPVKSFDGIENSPAAAGAVRDAWELLIGEGGAPVGLKDLAELASGEYSPASAWAAFRLLLDGCYFTGTVAALRARPREEVEAEERKREEKQREAGERERFLDGLRNRRTDWSTDQADYSRFIQDVEALAFGKSPRSKTMKDVGLSETPEDAHALLLSAGFWTAAVNPHPARWGLSTGSAKIMPDPPPAETRRDLTHLAAFAIDSPWSTDPDDALSIEIENPGTGRRILYVHVADPASSIGADRGATLYLPEGSSRMLADGALPLFALGLSETSPALTFKMTLDGAGEIIDTEIFPALVRVKRLTYEAADQLIAAGDGAGAVLGELAALGAVNLRRRNAAGAVNIELPETHIAVSDGAVSITPITAYQSADLVRECMLIAGEGAGLWAAGQWRGQSGETAQSLPFPYVSQEPGDLPGRPLPGMAGYYQLRRCMRPRSLSTRPGRHWGLGLDTYTQVTSPLRRYTDLLAHLQIRALLRGEALLSADEAAARLAAGEAAAAAVVQAERASRAHWTMVYLSQHKNTAWDAVALEKKGNRWVLMIPALALETQVSLRSDPEPNEHVELTLKSVNIPRGEAVFSG